MTVRSESNSQHARTRIVAMSSIRLLNQVFESLIDGEEGMEDFSDLFDPSNDLIGSEIVTTKVVNCDNFLLFSCIPS